VTISEGTVVIIGTAGTPGAAGTASTEDKEDTEATEDTEDTGSFCNKVKVLSVTYDVVAVAGLSLVTG
jgi:hypothetical protein